MNPDYARLMNDVVAANYFGEVMAVELIARLLEEDRPLPLRQVLTRHLLDETRHANVTRALLLARGRDPLRDDARADFAFHRLFAEFGSRGWLESLAFLGENERISARNFAGLIRIAEAQEDREIVGLYSEILNDEVSHSHGVLQALPKGNSDVARARAEARTRMARCVSLRYIRLHAAFAPPFKPTEEAQR